MPPYPAPRRPSDRGHKEDYIDSYYDRPKYPPKCPLPSSYSNLSTPPRSRYSSLPPPPPPTPHFLRDKRPSPPASFNSYYDQVASVPLSARNHRSPFGHEEYGRDGVNNLKNRHTNTTESIQKYREHPAISSRSPTEIESFRLHHQMTINGSTSNGPQAPGDIGNTSDNVTPHPRPIISFKETPFPSTLIQRLEHLFPAGPTPIQSQGWPLALSGRDMIGVASTGSGKTLAYILPAIERLIYNSSSATYTRSSSASFYNSNTNTRKPKVLIIAPTRELVNQIGKEFTTFSPASLRSVCIYGGAARGPQLSHLRRGADVAICTPGRLLDFIEGDPGLLEDVEYAVLDEADRMLDLGFEPQIRRILRSTPSTKQTLMWSATWPKEVESLAKDFLRNPLHLNVGSSKLSSSPNVEQIVKVCDEREKLGILKQILRDLGSCFGHDYYYGSGSGSNGIYNSNNNIKNNNNNNSQNKKVLIFTSTKRRADHIARILREEENLPAMVIHGDKSQAERERVLRRFREAGRSSILVATDVASRGLDVRDVKMVVNYDMSGGIEDYVHRIGRTGRGPAGHGVSITLFTKDNAKLAPLLVELLRGSGGSSGGAGGAFSDANESIPPELLMLAESQHRSRYGNYSRFSRSNNGSSCGYGSGGGGNNASTNDNNYSTKNYNNNNNNNNYGRQPNLSHRSTGNRYNNNTNPMYSRPY